MTVTDTEAWVPADTFGSRLLLVRLHLGLSQDEIASRCGVRAPTWHTWEHGTSPRNMAEVVDKIVAGTGVNRDWLMWGPARSRWFSLALPPVVEAPLLASA